MEQRCCHNAGGTHWPYGQSGSRFWVLTGAANCGERSMPSGSQCVPSMFVSQINCIVSSLCLLLTGRTNDKFSLSQEALTVNVTCRFTSWSPSNNAKRLTIKCCHWILSFFPITCASLRYTHTPTHTASGNSCSCRLWDWWHRHTVSDGHFQLCSLSPLEAGGVISAWKAHYRDESGMCGERLACSFASGEWNN